MRCWNYPRIEGCPKPTPTQPFVTPHISLFSGCKAEIAHLLTMRADICHYCAILDMYAPCIVSYRTWNDDANMNRYCCTTDLKLFNAHVLSVSDEAFLLLVLINGGARWMAEIKREFGKVSCRSTVDDRTPFFVHYITNPKQHRTTARGQKNRNLQCP